ncbi:hypothetical protein VTK26DRAFT_7707 [Humicola hyalothermophila]
MEARNEEAQFLADSGIWGPSRRAKKSTGADRYRVNIVGKEMCKDILDYIKPTLGRHEGCDLIDIFPGVGVWSTALNNALKPRSHLLLEPDADFYEPVLKPLLERPGTKLLKESGIVWHELAQVLNANHLPHQVEQKPSPDTEPQRNDTLLVTMNVSMYPTRRFRRFDSLASLLLYQMIASIRPGALFQKYGLVRMLIWTAESDMMPLLPRTVQRRRKTAVEAEVSTDWVCQIAGPPVDETKEWYRRDKNIDLDSIGRVVRRMEELGIKTPPGRESNLMRDFRQLEKPVVAGEIPPEISRPFYEELEQLESAKAQGLFSPDSEEARRHRNLLYWIRANQKRYARAHDHLVWYKEVVQAFQDAAADPSLLPAAEEKARAWNDHLDSLDKVAWRQAMLHIDNVEILHRDPPILNWDRRYVDPLTVQPDEFFPNVPCALIDIQPKAAARALREIGPGSTHAGDTFDLMLRSLFSNNTTFVSKALESIQPGAADGVLQHCPSMKDISVGGCPFAELPMRRLGERQLVELVEGWMKWPFRPQYTELVARTADESWEEAESENPAKAIPPAV